MLRVVLDTNVYVSAFVFGGAPLEILRLGIRGHVAVFVSDPILEELQAVLRRKRVADQRPPGDARCD